MEDGTKHTGLLDAKPKRGTGRMIRRRAYTKKNGTRVPARLIRDVGAKGKWRYEHMGAPGIGPMKKGLMTAVGYSVTAPVTKRHEAVDRAVRKYGKLSTLRKLNAVAVYTRRTSPAKSRRFKSDVAYVQKKYY